MRFSLKYYFVAHTVDSMRRLSQGEIIGFLGENRDFGVFLRLTEKKLTEERTANSNFDLIY